jgi:ubiquinone/menaquinone biosynthesis C-methylase UbiE
MDARTKKKEYTTVKRKNLHYTEDEQGRLKRYRPWLGDAFSFLYDNIMEKSIFPGKFNADLQKHYEILQREFREIHHANMLEIATGSGNAAYFLNPDNPYTGVDISPGLLKKAYSRLRAAGFKQFELYVAAADDLPFGDHTFDAACCHLSLNFFKDIGLFIKELKRVIKPGATFYCSAPVPERKPAKSTIHGTLYTEKELSSLFLKSGFRFESKPYENGALLYFTATGP